MEIQPLPEHRNRKIAIIGAGPSGIFIAKFLSSYGFTNITMYGNTSANQATSIMARNGIKYDIGTCHTHAGYSNSIIKMAKLKDMAVAQMLIDGELEDAKEPNLETKLRIAIFCAHSAIFKIFNEYNVTNNLYAIDFESYLGSNFIIDTLKDNRVFTFGSNGQGYGYLDEVTAKKAFNWFKPSIFGADLKMVEGTYASFFDGLYKNLKINKIIDNVTTDELGTIQREFDDVFVCCDPRQFNYFDKFNADKYIEHAHVISFLFESETLIPNLNHRFYDNEKIKNKEKDVVITIRMNDSYEKDSKKYYIYWAFGYASGNEKNLEHKVISQLETEYKLLNIHVLYFNVFEYNVRFNAAAIKNGMDRTINGECQRDNVYLAGGLMSHWDVDSIYEHSKKLTTEYCQKYSSFFGQVKCILRKEKLFWLESW